MNYLRLLQLRRAANGVSGSVSGAGAAAGAGTGASDSAVGASGTSGTSNTDASGGTDASAGTDAGGGKSGDSSGTDVSDTGEKTFTQADIDRVVQQTIAKERARADKAVENARTEAEKLAKMTADERAEHEKQQREEALQKREAELNRRELRATALETLAGKGLPAALADTLDYADADHCNASIASIEKAYRLAVQQGVEARMKSSAPTATDGSSTAMLDNLRAAAGLKTTK